jgi:hypothetical protein
VSSNLQGQPLPASQTSGGREKPSGGHGDRSSERELREKERRERERGRRKLGRERGRRKLTPV